MNYIFLALITVFYSFPGYAKSADNVFPLIVTVNELGHFPERFDGKLVSLSGYCSLQFEETAIYDTEEHFKYHRAEDGVWLDFTNRNFRLYNSIGETIERSTGFEGLPVILEGFYSAHKKGHFSLYNGSSYNISKVTIYNDENALRKNAKENLTFYISNQSLFLNPVDITVKINSAVAVSDTFDVKGKRVAQHNWIKYKFRLPAEKYQIAVASILGNTSTEWQIVIENPVFLNIEYQFSPGFIGEYKNKKFFQIIEDIKDFRFQ